MAGKLAKLIVRCFKWFLMWFGIGVVSSFASLFWGTEWLPEIVFLIPFGWIEFVSSTVPQVRFNGVLAIQLFVCSAVFILGMHWMLSWLVASDATTEPNTQYGNQSRMRIAFVLFGLLVAGFVAGIAVVGVGHQTVWLLRMPRQEMYQPGLGIRTSSRIVSSRNQLKQFAIASLNYESNHNSLPKAVSASDDGRPLHGWATVLLPYLEENGLYKSIDLGKAWDDPANLPASQTEVYMFRFPGIWGDGVTTENEKFPSNHYSANVHLLRSNTSVRLEDVSDGLTKTLLIGEAAGNFKPWAQPGNWRDVRLGLSRSHHGFGNPIGRQTSFVMLDGSALTLADDIDPKVLTALATPAGGEKVEVPADHPPSLDR